MKRPRLQVKPLLRLPLTGRHEKPGQLTYSGGAGTICATARVVFDPEKSTRPRTS